MRRRAKLKRLTAEDQERIMKSRALPANFDMTQAMHGPYGAQSSSTGMSIQPPVYTTYDASSPTRYISSHASDFGPFSQTYAENGVVGASVGGYSMGMPFEKSGMPSGSASASAHAYPMSSGRPHDSPMQPGHVANANGLAMAHDMLAQQLPRLGGAVQPTFGQTGPAMMYGISAWAVQAPQSQPNFHRSASISNASSYGNARPHNPNMGGSVEEISDDPPRQDNSLVSANASRYSRTGNYYSAAPAYASYNSTSFSVTQGLPQSSSGMQWPPGAFPPHQ